MDVIKFGLVAVGIVLLLLAFLCVLGADLSRSRKKSDPVVTIELAPMRTLTEGDLVLRRMVYGAATARPVDLVTTTRRDFDPQHMTADPLRFPR